MISIHCELFCISSGIVSLILSFFIESFYIQFAVFVILGIILLITTRPILQKILKIKDEKTNLDRVIGMTAIVTETITKNEVGEVKVDGKRWTAYADNEIDIGCTVKVLDINGVKIKVKKEEE